MTIAFMNTLQLACHKYISASVKYIFWIRPHERITRVYVEYIEHGV